MRKFAIVASAILALLLTSDDSSAKGKPNHAEKRAHGPAKNVHHEKKAYRHKKAHRHVVHEFAHRRGGPPPWAPAHGYRHQHSDRHAAVGYVVPFGILSGTCHRDALGAALGAAGGGLLAAELSGGDARAIFGGLLGGALLGGALGDAAAGVDRDCFGQALEHAPSRETVTWRNPDEDTTYRFTPTRTYEADGGRYCREYTTSVTISGREETAYGTACRRPDGSWEPR